MDPAHRPDAECLARLLERDVEAVEVERPPGPAAGLGLERALAICFTDGMRFPLPPGNRLRSAGEILEVRALLAGLPRELAATARRALGGGDPWEQRDTIAAMLHEALMDPDGAFARWSAT